MERERIKEKKYQRRKREGKRQEECVYLDPENDKKNENGSNSTMKGNGRKFWKGRRGKSFQIYSKIEELCTQINKHRHRRTHTVFVSIDM
jgi:hypothetical protein